MILTIIAIAILMICIAAYIYDNHIAKHYLPDGAEGLYMFFGIASAAILFIFICFIIGSHSGVTAKIQKDQIRRDALIEQKNLIDSDYEDISKTQVIADIADWNTEVIDARYWSNNLWTNWFYSKQRTDML
ncbi:MAG: hypothetical protein IKS69_00755, partial [Erysipelotrichaceae bacterium]|nr:hypothetical protein [Erysipelotrichaceae bacterium]